MEKIAELYAVRPATDNDKNFILNSWLKSFKGSDFAKGLRNGVYFNNHHALLQALWGRCEVQVVVNPEDSESIIGYVVSEVRTDLADDAVFILHFAYVKHIYRKMGIAKAAVAHAVGSHSGAKCYTHQLIGCRTLLKEDAGWVYNPYLLFI